MNTPKKSPVVHPPNLRLGGALASLPAVAPVIRAGRTICRRIPPRLQSASRSDIHPPAINLFSGCIYLNDRICWITGS